MSLPAPLSTLPKPLTHADVFDALQIEFCPLLDSALVAAFLSEVDFKSSSNINLASSLRKVYETLQSIAPHAEAEAAAEELQDLVLSGAGDGGTTSQNGIDPSHKSKSTNGRGKRQRSGTATTNTTMTTTTNPGTWPFTTSKSDSGSSKSGPSSPSTTTFESVDPHALAFLRTALPQLSTRALINALSEWEEKQQRVQGFSSAIGTDTIEDDGTGDIWALISRLVEGEEEREMDERGVDSDLGSGDSITGEDTIDGLYLGGIGHDAHYDGRLAQLEEDERLARELALQFEEESRDPGVTVLAKKGERVDGDEWIVPGKKGKNAKKGKGPKKNHARQDSAMKITLNDVRQQGQAIQPQFIPPGADSKTVNGAKVEGRVVPDLDLDVFLPSLSSYLTSLLPVDRPPSTMFLQAGAPSKASDGKDSKAKISTYIQNVFLNDRVVKTKFSGKVYRAVRSCLEGVVQVAHEVKANADEKRRAREQLEKEREEEAFRAVEETSQNAGLEVQRGENRSRHERNRGRGGKGERGKRLPPTGPPHPPSRKMKNRARTATDRGQESEWEPGEPGEAEGEAGRVEGRKKAEGSAMETTGVQETKDLQEAEDSSQQLLFTLLDILLPQYALVDSDEGVYVEVHQLLSDIELCTTVLSGSIGGGRGVGHENGSVNGNEKERGESALDLATLLCELYVSDADPGREAGLFMDMLAGGGGYGSALGKRQVLSYADTAGAARKAQLRGPVQAWGAGRVTGPSIVGRSTAAVQWNTGDEPDEKSKGKPSPYQWQAVPSRRAPMKKTYTILPHLPTYKRDVNGIKVRDESDGQTRTRTWVPGSASEYEEAEREHRRKVHENERRRKELLREAARMYNRSTQGPVAYYFAERAQECLDAARKEQVNAARAMVLRKQAVSGDHDAIDLHGTTVAEAEVIVLEMLGKRRQGQFKIITGRGNHSVGGASVLKPALKKRLSEEGYAVRAWDAGLFVTIP